MPNKQIHKRLSDDQVKLIFEKYCKKEINAKTAQTMLGISKSRFYQILPKYRDQMNNFSLDYQRSKPTRSIDPVIEANILQELEREKKLVIDNPATPVKFYNYSYIQEILKNDYGQSVSLPTIISRAKDHGYTNPKKKKKIHDREVISNYIGELIQHDSSHHLFAPLANKKWKLITSLDDYSRALLYADLVESETTWSHIYATQCLCLKYGFPFSYYADQHSIFRYVRDRDKNHPWYRYEKYTDDVKTQWQMVLKDCSIKPIYALSPQAKGKIERPYRWLQDHLVRTCLRAEVATIQEARKILKNEVYQYNCKRVHSTTGEIPMIRFNQAKDEAKSMFRPFHIPKPFRAVKDIFSIRFIRIIDSYRHIHICNTKIKVPKVPPKNTIEVRAHLIPKENLVYLRFWCQNQFISQQIFKLSDLPIVQF